MVDGDVVGVPEFKLFESGICDVSTFLKGECDVFKAVRGRY